MATIIPDPKKIKAFASAAAFEQWLSKHHAAQDELYLRIYKKDSGVATVTYAQALEVALCWGWIDGLKKSFDTQSFLQRFTPRRDKSIWSANNREHVARLIAAERMTEHGLRHVTSAKRDGRWDAAYESPKNTSVPADLQAAIDANPKARETFETLNKANRYALSFRVNSLKTPAGRAKRIAQYVTMLSRGEAIHEQVAAKAKPKVKSKHET